MFDPGGCGVEDGVGGGVDYGYPNVVLLEKDVGFELGHWGVGHVGPVGLPAKLVVDHRVGAGKCVGDHCQPGGPV